MEELQYIRTVVQLHHRGRESDRFVYDLPKFFGRYIVFNEGVRNLEGEFFEREAFQPVDKRRVELRDSLGHIKTLVGRQTLKNGFTKGNHMQRVIGAIEFHAKEFE